MVRRFYPEVETYEDAVRAIIENTDIDKSQKNIILSHQFITKTGAETMRSDSESVSVGGLDNIDISVFDDFDYTALGHIHRPQSLSEKVRYCGSPLKYSFSEAKYDKTVIGQGKLAYCLAVEVRTGHDFHRQRIPVFFTEIGRVNHILV